MKILRSAALIGIGRAVYQQAKKPENQAKIKEAVEQVKKSRQARKPR
jgi:hypothetical protein